MASISWGLSRYPYYDSKGGVCDYLYECICVLFCCKAGFVDSNDSDSEYDEPDEVNLKRD